MKKVIFVAFTFVLLFGTSFMAAGSDAYGNSFFKGGSDEITRENFSVKKKYEQNWQNKPSYYYASSDMKNYDAQGYSGDALSRLYVANSEAVVLCSARDTDLTVNQHAKCTIRANQGVQKYQSTGYYYSIEGQTSTSKKVFTILS